MTYLVQREDKLGEWETLYAEDEALKADLLMVALTRTRPNERLHEDIQGYHYRVNGYRVAWQEPEETA